MNFADTFIASVRFERRPKDNPLLCREEKVNIILPLGLHSLSSTLPTAKMSMFISFPDCLTVFVYQFLELSVISRKTGGGKKTVVVRCIDLQEGRCDYFKRRDGLIYVKFGLF